LDFGAAPGLKGHEHKNAMGPRLTGIGSMMAALAMLAEDAALTMPPIPTWFRGRDVVAAFLHDKPFAAGNRWRVLPTQANGQPAFGHYLWDQTAQAFVPRELVVLTLNADRIAELTIFRDSELLGHFDLPDHVA
jgi:RNA polymerase sigma-70 factor (ECF subfamily)